MLVDIAKHGEPHGSGERRQLGNDCWRLLGWAGAVEVSQTVASSPRTAKGRGQGGQKSIDGGR